MACGANFESVNHVRGLLMISMLGLHYLNPVRRISLRRTASSEKETLHELVVRW